MKITTEENRISIDGISYPKDAFYVKPISKGVRLVAMSELWSIKILVDGTTIDGNPVADRDELITFFNEQGFKSGGSGPGTETSWGDIIDKPAVIASGDTQAAARTSLGLGSAATSAASAFATAAQGGLAATALQPSDAADVSEAGKVVKYSNIGAVNTAMPEFPENAVPLALLNIKVPDGGTNGQVLKKDASGNNVWSTDANTTYSVITEAEFNTGTSSTARAVSAASLNRDINAKLDLRLSAAQRAAIDELVSPTEDYADMTEATAAIKSIIDALKAT